MEVNDLLFIAVHQKKSSKLWAKLRGF